MTSAQRLPRVAADVEFADFDTEIVALVPARRQAVLLEGGHALVVDSCRRNDAIAPVVNEIAQASGDELARVEAWLDGVLRELARIGVVVPGRVTDPRSSGAEDAHDEAS